MAVDHEQRSPDYCQPSYTFDSKKGFDMHQPGGSAKPGSSSAAEDLHIEDVSSRDPGYDDDAEVVKPYAIEEPGDESPSVVSRLAISAPSDDAELWQEALVDSMEGLHCDSDHNNLGYCSDHKRGKKRKPPSFAVGSSGSVRRESFGTVPDVQYERPSLSPKRLRRQTKRSKEDLRTTWDSFSQRSLSSETELSTSPSPSPRSTDANGTSLANKATVTDEMDID